MKLAIVTAYPPSKVTLNEYAYHLVRSFRQKNQIDEIVLLTDCQPNEEDLDFGEAGCTVRAIPCWEFNSLTNVVSVSKALHEEKPDAVLYNLQFMKFGDHKIAAALGLLLPAISKAMKIPTIVLLHNIMETVDLETAGFTKNPVLKLVFSLIGSMLTRIILGADMVAVTLKKYVDVLSEKYGASHVVQIPHGTFDLVEEPNYDAVPNGPLQIMTFGKFGTYKKVENMIEAVELIRKRTNLDLEVVIAGTDNPNVPGYLESVKEKYADVEQVRFTGYVAEEDVAGLFADSTAVVFPYTSTTGSSGVLHQAGSYGKAVVMPDLGDLALLMEDEGYQAELFDPICVESLADAIEKIASDADHRIALGKANYQAATAYPMSRIADMYLDRFEQLVQRKLTPSLPQPGYNFG